MTERVRALGGELKIVSGQNGGTVLELQIPYDEAVAAQGQSPSRRVSRGGARMTGGNAED